MSKSTISTFELFQMFPDQESARLYFEARRWPDGATCPACGESKRIASRKNGFYRCNACLLDFTVRTGTIFGRSKVPLNKWLDAICLSVVSCNGISSLQLTRQIGVTQKTAWFMLKRLREACGHWPPEDLKGNDCMSEAICAVLEAVVDRVLAFRPANKGQPNRKIRQQALGG
jgi:transposase-like protein